MKLNIALGGKGHRCEYMNATISTDHGPTRGQCNGAAQYIIWSPEFNEVARSCKDHAMPIMVDLGLDEEGK